MPKERGVQNTYDPGDEGWRHEVHEPRGGGLLKAWRWGKGGGAQKSRGLEQAKLRPPLQFHHAALQQEQKNPASVSSWPDCRSALLVVNSQMSWCRDWSVQQPKYLRLRRLQLAAEVLVSPDYITEPASCRKEPTRCKAQILGDTDCDGQMSLHCPQCRGLDCAYWPPVVSTTPSRSPSRI